MDVAARGERLEEPPLGSRQVLEAVREDGRAAPRVELAGEPLDRATAERAAVPGAQPLQLVAVGAQQALERLRELVGVDERAVEIGDRPAERVGVPREAADRRGPALRDATQDECALGVARARASGPRPPGRGARRGRRRCRRCRRAALRSARPARARRARRPHGSGRRATDLDRARRRTGRAAGAPSRRAPDRRRGRVPPEHGSRAVRRPPARDRDETTLRARNPGGCVPIRCSGGVARTMGARDPARAQPEIRPAISACAATGDGRAGHRSCARIAEVGGLGATPRVGERDAHHRALSLLHFRAALVANQNGLSRHDSSRSGQALPRFHLDR